MDDVIYLKYVTIKLQIYKFYILTQLHNHIRFAQYVLFSGHEEMKGRKPCKKKYYRLLVLYAVEENTALKK